jgi:serine/threonine protein kinase
MELVVLSKLDHSNVIKTYDVVDQDNTCFIILELCEGGDLDMYVKRKGFLT